MFVAIDKPTAVRMYDYIMEYWPEYLLELERRIETLEDEQELIECQRRYEKVKATEVCVVVSSEQNEVDKFKKYGLDITSHRKKMVARDLEKEFKDPDNPFRLAIVCAMWITGFDAPSVSTIYLDKPIKGHTLMQTIARANRIYDDEKENGLIVDYGNVYQQLEEAYSVYGEGGKGNSGSTGSDEDTPTKTLDELAEELEQVIKSISAYLDELNFDLLDLIIAQPIEKLKQIREGINAVCLNETSRAKFEVLARDMFRKYKALFPEEQIKPFVQQYSAIEAIYNALNQKVKEADIIEVIVKLQDVVNDSVEIVKDKEPEPIHIDLSKLDFDALKKAYGRIDDKNSVVYDLQSAIDKKLKRMLAKNPSRMELYEKYQKIIDEYNNGKDAEATKKAFEELVKFLSEMDEEEHRAAREGLDEETLAIYDLLKKDKLSKKESDEVKNVAKETLEKLKTEKL